MRNNKRKPKKKERGGGGGQKKREQKKDKKHAPGHVWCCQGCVRGAAACANRSPMHAVAQYRPFRRPVPPIP
eukprot:3937182-Rhodomonas_salina.1